MAFVDLGTLGDRVQAIIRLVPDSLLNQEGLRITREFCDFTRAWEFEADPITLIANTSTYDVQLPDANQCEPIAINYMSVDQHQCFFRTKDWLDRNIDDWRKRKTNDFRYFTMLRPEQFTFPCVPTSNQKQNGCYYRVALKPSLDATQLDEDFYNRWGDALTIGVRACLYAMEGQPWANEKAAMYNQRIYDREKTRARIRFERSFGNPNPNVMVGAVRFGGR